MVSVIVPVYNTEQFLGECIRSIVNQTYRELEIIIINDGSTDGSGDICRKWKELDKRIRYVEKENEGQGVARNTGIQMANGEYIIFVDSDDYIDPDLVEKVYMHIRKWEADICVYSHRHVGEQIRELPLEGKTKRAMNVRDNKELLGVMPPILWDKMFSAELIQNSDILMSNRMCEDLVFNAQLYVKANKICFLDIPFYNYRYTRIGNFSTNYQKYHEVEQSVDELNEVFSQNGNFEIYWVQLYQLSLFIFKNILSRIESREELHLPAEAENSYDMFFKTYRHCLNRWFSHHIDCSLQEKQYLILGSYNLRVMIHSLLLNENFSGEDYGYSSLISLMSAPTDMGFSLEACTFKNAYRERCVRQDMEKNFYCHAEFRDQGYIVMDLLDEICDLIKVSDDCYITESEFLKELDLKELNDYRRIAFGSEERRKLFTIYADRFAEKVRLQNLPVIVIKNFLCERHSIYYDESVNYENLEEIREINRELEWHYQQLLLRFPDAVVVDSSEFKELVFTHDKFPFGCRPVYYNTGYYQRMAVRLSQCVRERTQGSKGENGLYQEKFPGVQETS